MRFEHALFENKTEKKIDKIKRKKLIKYGNFRNYDRWKPAETYAFEH